MATALLRRKRLIGPEFAFLASKAAIEIDDLLAGVDTSTNSIADLSALLNASINEGLKDSKSLSLAAPGAVEVISNAVAQTENAVPVTIADLVVKANTLVKRLQATGIEQSEGELTELRSFCAALSMAASDYLARHSRSIPSRPHKY